MGTLIPLIVKYGIPALMKLWPIFMREVERRQIEAETGKKIQHAFYDEQRRIMAMDKEELLRQ